MMELFNCLQFECMHLSVSFYKPHWLLNGYQYRPAIESQNGCRERKYKMNKPLHPALDNLIEKIRNTHHAEGIWLMIAQCYDK